MAKEHSAVQGALQNNRIPTPSGREWDAICRKYPNVTSEKHDIVQSSVQLPPGWTVKEDPDDPYGRSCVIRDHEGQRVGGTFLKDSGYDYYGYTYFNKDRLVELGIPS